MTNKPSKRVRLIKLTTLICLSLCIGVGGAAQAADQPNIGLVLLDNTGWVVDIPMAGLAQSHPADA